MQADNGSEQSIRQVADAAYDEGEYERAFAAYLKLAEHEDGYGQIFVGWMYQSGTGTRQDLEKAKYWYRKAAEKNDAEAQFRIAAILQKEGQYEASFEWLDKAVEQGYPPAITRLGFNYSRGRGVPVDKDKALNLWEYAAQRGNFQAKLEFAKLLLRGRKGFSIFFAVVTFLFAQL